MNTETIAVVDVNNCYASVERVFRPDLRTTPIAVLSNNDGCIIARSQELKEMGVYAGEPYFKRKDLLSRMGVKIFSSNYSLYHDMTHRIFWTIKHFVSEIEIYSIDEAFIALTGYENTNNRARLIRSEILQRTKIPVSIGIGSTKTLAKLASHIAKKNPEYNGVCNIADLDFEKILQTFPIEELWGIGRQSATFLKSVRIDTAYKLIHQPITWIKKHLTIRGVAIVEEIQGVQHFPLHMDKAAKKGIMASRSFAKGITDIRTLREAVAYHTDYAARKLRQQNYLAKDIGVYIRTNMHNKERKYVGSTTIHLPDPVSFTPTLTKAAHAALEKIYKPNYIYWKVGVTLNNLVPEKPIQSLLFGGPDWNKQKRIMDVYDILNMKYGSGTATTAGMTLKSQKHLWEMKRDLLSPSYTTKWSDLPRVV